MKHLKPKKLLLAAALALGLASPAIAQTIPDGYMVADNYLENFQSASASSSSTTLPLGWDRLTDKIGNASTYYATTTSGKEGKAFGNTKGQEHMYNNGEYVDLYDLIITPQVKGTISFYVGRYSTGSSYNPVVEVYKVTKTADGFTFNKEDDLLFEVKKDEWPTSSTSSVSGWAEQSFNVENYEYLGFRISYAYIDEFEASNAIIPINKSFEITAVTPSSQTIAENPDNTVTIGVTVKIQNTGNISLGTSLDEKLKLTLAKRLNSFAPYEYAAPFATVDIPVLAPNETAEIQISGDYPIPEGLTPNSSGELGLGNDFYALIDQFPTAFRTLGYIWVKPLKGMINIRYDKYTSASKLESVAIDKNIYYGMSIDNMEKTFHISNSGPADLVITGVTITNQEDGNGTTEGISVEDISFPYTIPSGGEAKDIRIVIGGAPGFKSANIKFNLDENGIALLDNVDVSGYIAPSDKYFEDFESGELIWYAPTGSDKWSVGTYDSNERSANNSFEYYPEFNINNYRLDNNQSSNVQPLYSPKMSFSDGDKISFFAAKKNNNTSGTQLTVSYSPDRQNWTELGTIKLTNTENPDLQFSQGTASSSTGGGQYIFKRYEFDMPAGEYYISLGGAYVIVDNFVGGTLIEVPYDIVSESAKAGGIKMVNNPITFEASFKNIGSAVIAAKKQTITLYANGVAVATAEASDLPVKQETIYNFSYIPHAAGETNLFAELAIGDYTVKSPIVTVKINPESSEIGNVIGDGETTATNIPFQFNWTHSGMETIYTTAQLSGMGLENKEITKIAFPYKKANAHGASEVKIWIQNTDDTAVPNPAAFYADWSEEELYFNDPAYIVEACPDDFGELIFTLNKPFSYEDGKNIRVRIDLKCQTDGSKGNTAIATFKANKNIKDPASTRWSEDTFTGKYTPSRVTTQPQIILYTEEEVPTISGTVKDVDGNGIEGATVTATAKEADVYYTTTTDSDGNWSMTIFQPDYEYTVSASDDDYITTLPVALDMEEANDLVMYTTGLAFDTINTEVVKGEGDQTAQFDINIISKEEGFSYQGFQFDLTIPSSISIPEKGITGAMTISVSDPKEDSESNTITYKVVGYDGEKASTELEGIVSVTLTIPGYVEDTVYPINDIVTITGVDFSTPTGSDVEGEGYIGELIISKKIVHATAIELGALTLEAPSYSSSPAESITAGESITATVTLEPAKYTTDEKTDIQWTSSADGITVELDDEGNLVITAAKDYQGGDITITGTIGEITIERKLTGKAILLGDANANDKVTVADVVTTANVVAAEGNDVKPNVLNFCYPNANVVDDEDGNINIDDVMGIVDIILYGEVGGSKSIKRHASTLATADRLVADNFRVSAGKETVINVCLDNSINYTGLQAFVNIPEGMKVTKVTKGARAAAHDMAVNISDSRVGVVLYSLTKAEFADSNDALFQLHVVAEENCEGISIDGIRAVDPASNGYNLAFDGGMNETGTTGIDSIDALDADARYFDINGIELKASQLQPGIYIRVKGDKTEKIVIR